MLCNHNSIDIYFVTENWWPTIGGLETSIFLLSKALSYYANVKILIPSTKEKRDMPENVTTTILNRDGFFDEVVSYVLGSKKKRKIVHLFGYSYFDKNGQIRLIKKLYYNKIPSVLKVPTLGHTSKFSCRSFIDYVSCFVALTDEIACELKEKGVNSERIFKVPNGVDVQYYSISNNENSQLTLGFAGRFTNQKQVGKLLLFCKLSPSFQDITIKLIGEFDNTYGDAEKFDIPANASLCKPTHDLRSFYQSIDIYVSMSREEGMPNSVLEAMASGKPLILSNISGHRELVKKNGWLVNDKKEFQLALDNAISEWKHRSLTQRGELSRMIVEHDYDIVVIAKRYFEKYQELLVQ